MKRQNKQRHKNCLWMWSGKLLIPTRVGTVSKSILPLAWITENLILLWMWLLLFLLKWCNVEGKTFRLGSLNNLQILEFKTGLSVYFCKGRDSKYFRLWEPYIPCHNYQNLLLEKESINGPYVKEWVWLCSYRPQVANSCFKVLTSVIGVESKHGSSEVGIKVIDAEVYCQGEG